MTKPNMTPEQIDDAFREGGRAGMLTVLGSFALSALVVCAALWWG